MIEPGAQLGVLGGGQLGSLFVDAAHRLGYRVAVWDPDPDAPALAKADLSCVAPFTATPTRERFAAAVQAATIEWENIPANTCEALERSIPLWPESRILSLLQNRLTQKAYFSNRGIPVSPYIPIYAMQDLNAVEHVGFPSVLKTATSGYDGKGQWRVTHKEDLVTLADAFEARPPFPLVAEQWLGFQKELSVVVVRSQEGECRIYPVAENRHENGILRVTRVPARIEPSMASKAEKLAQEVIDALQGVGVFCVELFLMPDGVLYVNEVAPRPHNSGHYTLDACSVSQFEQQVRIVSGLPLGEVRLVTPAIMVNLLGPELDRVQSPAEFGQLFQGPEAILHDYGKRETRPGRKMGHVTFVGEEAEQRWRAASLLGIYQEERER